MAEQRWRPVVIGPDSAAVEPLLTVKEAAARCALSPKAFVLRVYHGQVPRECVTAPIGDRVYIRAGRLAAFFEPAGDRGPSLTPA